MLNGLLRRNCWAHAPLENTVIPMAMQAKRRTIVHLGLGRFE
jgi:hypothetical protein